MEDPRVFYYLSWLIDFEDTLSVTPSQSSQSSQTSHSTSSSKFDDMEPVPRTKKFRTYYRERKHTYKQVKTSDGTKKYQYVKITDPTEKSKKVFTKAVSTFRSDKYFVDISCDEPEEDPNWVDEFEPDEYCYLQYCHPKDYQSDDDSIVFDFEIGSMIDRLLDFR